jgi:hypothetical protein
MTRPKGKKKAAQILAKAEAIHRKALKKAAMEKKKGTKGKPVDLPSEWKASD